MNWFALPDRHYADNLIKALTSCCYDEDTFSFDIKVNVFDALNTKKIKKKIGTRYQGHNVFHTLKHNLRTIGPKLGFFVLIEVHFECRIFWNFEFWKGFFFFFFEKNSLIWRLTCLHWTAAERKQIWYYLFTDSLTTELPPYCHQMLTILNNPTSFSIKTRN